MGAPGFDDAPFWSYCEGIAQKDITLVYPYYDNPKFFLYQLQKWETLPTCIKDRLRFVVVDDCSPTTPAFSVVSQRMWTIRLRLFRIEVDIRWNWLGARNIGMQHAATGWCVLTDMDHVVPEETLKSLIRGNHSSKAIYRFSRKESTGEQIHPHPNSMFMTRDMFWKIGGYDERMSGYYGSDGYWRRRCVATAPIYTLRDSLIRHEYQQDSSTIRYLRKQPEDARLRPLVKSFKTGSKALVLSFPYREIPI
jgi:hypothetical protein